MLDILKHEKPMYHGKNQNTFPILFLGTNMFFKK